MRGDTPLMQLPLEDVKILDLSHALAGPFCSTMLGDFGAQVVKVEVPGTGDIARGWGPPFYNTETTYFVSLHRNKKALRSTSRKRLAKNSFSAWWNVLTWSWRTTVSAPSTSWALPMTRHACATLALFTARYRVLARQDRIETARPWISSCRLRAA